MTEKMKVEKRDGRFELYDRAKVISSVIKAGVTPEEAEDITSRIDRWLTVAPDHGVVKSSQIRARLIEILRTMNPEAAAAFGAYKKPEAESTE